MTHISLYEFSDHQGRLYKVCAFGIYGENEFIEAVKQVFHRPPHNVEYEFGQFRNSTFVRCAEHSKEAVGFTFGYF